MVQTRFANEITRTKKALDEHHNSQSSAGPLQNAHSHDFISGYSLRLDWDELEDIDFLFIDIF